MSHCSENRWPYTLLLAASLLVVLAGCSESKMRGGTAKFSGADNAVPCEAPEKIVTNIVLMLDASESQLIADPKNIRGAGAIDFVDRLIAHAADSGGLAKYSISVASFATDAKAGSGWHVATEEKRSLLAADISAATAKPLGFTNYHAALTLADNIFRALDDTDEQKIQTRNVLVFLTDGEPTVPEADPKGHIDGDVTRLVDGLGVSIVTVGVGSAVEAAGHELLRSMARSPTGDGEYIAAVTADDLIPAWRRIEAKFKKNDCAKP